MAEQIFTQVDADLLFDELALLTVSLDDDPVAFGPKRLNFKVSMVRRMLDRCERVFLDVSRRLQTSRHALRVIEAEIEMSKKHLFANDPETRAGRSVSDREAIASQKLKKEIQERNELELVTNDLEQVMLVVKAKRGDLKDTEGRLRDQMRLCQEELSLGHRWGSRVPDASIDLDQGTPARKSFDDAQEIADIISKVDAETHMIQDAPAQVEILLAPTLEEAMPLDTAKPFETPEILLPAETDSDETVSFEADQQVDPKDSGVLAPTVKADLADDFLGTFNLGPNEKEIPESKQPREKDVTMTENDLMSFLADFESNGIV